MLLIINKASTFVCRDMKYHTRWCCGHEYVPENNEQPEPFKFSVSNSAQKAQFSASTLVRDNAVMSTMRTILPISAL